MANHKPITHEQHGGKHWQPPVGYAFARQHHITPVAFFELSKLVLEWPVAFVRTEERFSPFVLFGIEAGCNLAVDRNDNWQGNYIPAFFRSYPFRLALDQSGNRIVCIDDDSGLVNDTGTGHPFFSEDGKTAGVTQSLIDMMTAVESNRLATQLMCDELANNQLIVPWEAPYQSAQGARTLAGLYKIDEAALNKLDSESIGKLHAANALPLAYFQLLSMQHLENLSQRAVDRRKTESDAANTPSLPLGNNSDSISIDDFF